jgi:rRNA maturation endonuclease Nob1
MEKKYRLVDAVGENHSSFCHDCGGRIVPLKNDPTFAICEDCGGRGCYVKWIDIDKGDILHETL